MIQARCADAKKRDWIADNRGVLARIARETGLSAPFVSDVFWLRRKHAVVTKILCKLNAPGFQQREVA
jgi:hypothetical protein